MKTIETIATVTKEVIGVANSVFLDTNILVYANMSESPFHQAALQAIENLYDAGIELWISRQVLSAQKKKFIR